MFTDNSRCALMIFLGIFGQFCCSVGRTLPSAEQSEQPRVDLDAFTFESGDLKALFRQFDVAIRRSIGRAWIHNPFRNTHAPHGAWYKAEWSRKEPLWDEARGFLTPPNHYMALSISPRTRTDVGQNSALQHIRLVAVSGGYSPALGWGALCAFSTDGPPDTDRFELTLYDFAADGSCVHELRLPGANCGGKMIYNGFAYRFGTSVGMTHGEAVVRKFLRSPESFRDAALAEQDRLEEAVRDGHAKSTLISDFVTPQGWDASEGQPPDNDLEPLSKAQQEEILVAALELINKKRSWIKSRYQEMHTAAVASVPLLECLDSVDRGRRSRQE